MSARARPSRIRAVRDGAGAYRALQGGRWRAWCPRDGCGWGDTCEGLQDARAAAREHRTAEHPEGGEE